MKNLICILILGLFTYTGYSKNHLVENKVTTLYQPEQQIKLIQQDIEFWTKKWQKSPQQSSYLLQLAAANSQLFSLTGQIDALIEAEELLVKALETPLINRSAALRALAHNYISQHRFCEALDLVLEASEIGENRFANDKMLFDIYLELGMDEQAGIQLTKITNNTNFDYLIRKAKWEDGKGNLDKAILYLERAKKLAESSNNKSLMVWIYSNLGDFYGHQGAIEKSYKHFKQTLELDPANWYALKGIAWIAYSHDKHIGLAENILTQVIQTNESPDLHLRLAELATYQNNKNKAQKAVQSFQNTIKKEAYGVMYSQYECLVAAEELGDFQRAYELANQEITNRPTTESYDLLAWTLFLDGKIEAAQQIAKEHILDKTSEPAILLHLAYIFYQDPTISQALLKEITAASFELGPLKTKAIIELNSRMSHLENAKTWQIKLFPKLSNPFWFLG